MICRSKLTYGLHTMALKDGQFDKLKAVQMKGLRKIMRLQHPYINRSNTNKKVLRDVNNILRMETAEMNRRRLAEAKAAGKKAKSIPHKPMTLINTEILNRTVAYLGHIIRAHIHDPLRQATLKKHKVKANHHSYMRVGRPRLAWLHTAARTAWARIRPKLVREGKLHFQGQRYDPKSRPQRKELRNYAYARFF